MLFNKMGLVHWSGHCVPRPGAGYEAAMGRTGCLDPLGAGPAVSFGLGQQYESYQDPVHAGSGRYEEGWKRVVLIESCAEDMAPYCDVLIRPGTDGALRWP